MKKILIVDDKKSWTLFHKEIIQGLYGNFFEITIANSASQALDIVKNNTSIPFTLIITDLQMENDYEPKLAGEWLIEQIKLIKEYAHTNIVIISSVFNVELIAKQYNVQCISKNMLVRNKLLMKFMFEKLMPSLSNIH